MKKSVVLLTVLVATFHLVAAEIIGMVTKVSDGDTIWVATTTLKREKVRLDRIDAPEADQPYGKCSTAALSDQIYGKIVWVDYKKRDQYGRILGVVYLDKTDINLKMVRDGHAWHYSYFDKTPAYVEAEKEARAEKRGLWKDPNPVNPYRWRKSFRK